MTMRLSFKSPALCPTLSSELVQVYCIFLFLCAASLFGTLISQVNEIVAAHSIVMRDLDTILEAYFSLQPRCVVLFGSVSKNTQLIQC